MNALAAVTAVAAARAVAGLRQAVSGRQPAVAAAPANADELTELSDPARLIEALLARDPDAGSGQAAGPLLAQPPTPGSAQTALTLALQRAFSQSGLFYESHLVAWLQGELPLAELAREPQGQLAVPAAAATAPNRPGPAAEAQSLQRSESGSAAVHEAPAWQRQVDPRVAGIVQQQLISLDTQVFPWRGEAWPGQPLECQITPGSDPDAGQSAAQPAGWSSRIRLTLPRLGAVDAELRWSAAGCSLRVAVAPQGLAELRAALPDLAGALAGAGIRTERIVASAQRETPADG